MSYLFFPKKTNEKFNPNAKNLKYLANLFRISLCYLTY